ncbi:MAG: hypothetical protein WA746_30580, partial [Isosphaeraceae bacterium]
YRAAPVETVETVMPVFHCKQSAEQRETHRIQPAAGAARFHYEHLLILLGCGFAALGMSPSGTDSTTKLHLRASTPNA